MAVTAPAPTEITFTPTPLAGHQAKWSVLSRGFAAGQAPQTLLLSGPPHIGKWTFLSRYAKLLLCPQPGTDAAGAHEACNQCRVCHQIDIEVFPDFFVMRPVVSSSKDERDWVVAPEAMESSGIYIDMARKFAREAMHKPLMGPRKVMALYGADRMNTEAQNALLKTFEEPSAGLSIILVATNPNLLLPTVRSRCWHLPLSLVGDGEIDLWLQSTLPGTSASHRAAAVHEAAGCPGTAWRAANRLTTAPAESLSRLAEAELIADRIQSWNLVGALRLTEDAQRLGRVWWGEDSEGKVLKKADAKITRSATMTFLDELAKVYRARWKTDIAGGAGAGRWADGLDLIRKTRHYILSNANSSLALDVMFARLIAMHHPRR